MPQQDLDLRSRLDGSGTRRGKVVDWRMSELRSLEIIESLCTGMDSDYAVVTGGDGIERYQKISNTDGAIHISGSMSFGDDASREKGKKLRHLCDAFVEEHEESLGRAIQQTPQGLRDKFCVEISAMCTTIQLEELVAEKIAKEEKIFAEKTGTHVSPGAQKWIDQDKKQREEEEEAIEEAERKKRSSKKKKKKKKRKKNKGKNKGEL
jgi:hypothetical protein